MGEERENGVAVQDKAMLGLTIEAAAAGGPPRRWRAAHPTGGGTTNATTSTEPTIPARVGLRSFGIAAHANTAKTTQVSTEGRTGTA